MSGQPPSRANRLHAFVAAVAVLAAVVVVVSAVVPQRAIEWAWWGALILLIATRVAEAGIVEIARDSDEAGYGISVASVPQLASAVLLPPPVAAMVAGLGMLLDELNARSPISRLAFNVSSTILSVGGTALGASLLGISGMGLAAAGWTGVASFVLVATMYYFLNTVPVACVGALAGGRPIRPALLQSARTTAPTELGLALLGGLAAFIWVVNPYWLLIGASPAIISQLALRYIAERNRKAAQLSALDRLGQQLSTGLTVEEVFQAVSFQMHGVRSVEGCFLAFSEGGEHFSYGLADRAGERAVAHGLAQRVQATGESLWLQDARVSLPGEHPEARSWLVLPLGRGDEWLGSLGLLSRAANAFANHDREFFTLVAERVALALEVARRSAELRRMAFHDVLTGLPNRALFAERLEASLEVAEARDWMVGVFYLDLDNFRVVNESLGHQAGDTLLVEVAARLAACLETIAANRADTSPTVARMGGDEFTILIDRIDGEAEAAEIADRLTGALRDPIQVAAHEVVTSASVGVALSGPGRDRPEALLRCADLALYRAKANGKNGHAVFDATLESHALERLELERDLRLALEGREFRLYYQPLIQLESGSLSGWEALVRWEHPVRGLIFPSAFIPIAEETGLIVPIGRWVVQEACRQAREWQDRFPSEPQRTMSVNLSARQFANPQLVDDVQNALNCAHLDPRLLVLEITESVVMQDAGAAVRILHQLKALGIRVAIDDFGTGYSSLAYLKRFPLDVLKIDRSFVEGLGHDAQDSAIVQSVVVLAKSLGLSVTAEGIETPRQQLHLQRLGCEIGQGYLFGKPRPAQDTANMLWELSAQFPDRRAA
jgi:diguanylate cyclase (GGDEF)-like protein